MIRVRCTLPVNAPLSTDRVRRVLLAALHARRHGGALLLRLDDGETARDRRDQAATLLQDLQWLGIHPDQGLRASDRAAAHVAAAAQLEQGGYLYPCFETPEELRARQDQRVRRGHPATYDRAALRLTPAQRAAALNARRPHWRFRLPEHSVTWQDRVLGPQTVVLSTLSDPIVRRADGSVTPALAAVVDDLDLAVTDVVRGMALADTAIELALRAALQPTAAAPSFAHLPPLATGSDGRRAAGTLRSLRQDGIEPQALAVYLAWLGRDAPSGLVPMDVLAAEIALDATLATPPRPDMRVLLSLNRRALAWLDFPDVADRLPPGATEAFWLAVRGNLDLLREARGWWDVVAGTIVAPEIEDHALLTTALELLPPEPWHGSVWQNWRAAVERATGRAGRALSEPLRLALTGEEDGPQLAALLPLIGRARAADRLRVACT